MLKHDRDVLLILLLFFLSLFLCVNGEHFVLVHGNFHGAWCWYKVATLLKSAGHNVTTLDMAGCGINPKQMEEVDSISEYHQPLMTFMDSLPPNQKVILVGHSFGGISVSVAMEKFPEKISIAVFVTAFVLSGNLAYPDLDKEINRRSGPLSDKQYFIFDGPDEAPRLSSDGFRFFASKLYQLSLDEDLMLASSLVRPLPVYAKDAKLITKETKVTKGRNGRVAKVYIITEKDNLLTKDSQMWIIEKTGPFANVKVIEDSDHMVMFSKSKRLSSELIEIAYKYSLHSDRALHF
ncbi:hypothetical protein VNO77_09171 [Canavalia gladiata]|uniref:AB hydrolase-1 domain-containing protein n=1 Tax=Canavalia gladiata TaxID=3824 RepID=A0AAN9MEF3_CANGL